MAMREAGASYTIRMGQDVMQRGRILDELAQGNTINLQWTSMDASAERALNVVRIPIHRGLIGYRIFIIHRDEQAAFDRVDSLDDLRRLTAVQGLGWVDTKILLNAKLKVDTADYDSMLRMVAERHTDYFPRGVLEAHAELAALGNQLPELTVERRLALAYRSDFLFYAAASQPALAAAIDRGLQAAYKNGAYLYLFNTHPYIQDGLRRADLAHRTIFHLDNPYLSQADRAIPDGYWMTL